MEKASDNKIIYSILNKVTKEDFKIFLHRSFNLLHPDEKFTDNWHIDYIIEYLDAVANGKVKRLIINLPPRYLKSFIISVAWPAWLLGNKPSNKILVASHSLSLAEKLSQDCKEIINSSWYNEIFNLKISSKQNTKLKFLTDRQGFRMACSINSSILGAGGDILIADDPITPTQVMSANKREFLNKWFFGTFLTRINNKKNGAVVIVMQRLHMEDLSAELIKKSDWELLKIEALSSKERFFNFNNFSYTRRKNEPLCDSIESLKHIQKAKKDLGHYTFAAQYQQDPIALNHSLIDAFKLQRYDKIEDFDEIYQSWDTAIKIGENNDYSVCSTIGIIKDKFYLIDVFRKKLIYPDLKKAVMKKFQEFVPDGVLIEDKGSGQQLIQDMKCCGIPVAKYMPKKSKMLRFLSIINIFESGKFYIPSSAQWLEEFESELYAFPNSKHDDQIDSMVQFLNWWMSKPLSQTTFNIRRLF